MSVCCHKNCPQCGGDGCGKFTDASGNKLGAKNCCERGINKTGEFKTCGSEGTKAPCVLPSDSFIKIADWLDIPIPAWKSFWVIEKKTGHCKFHDAFKLFGKN